MPVAGDVEEEILLAGDDGRAETVGRGVVEGELVEGRYAGQPGRPEECDEALEGDVELFARADGGGGAADDLGAVGVAGEVGPQDAHVDEGADHGAGRGVVAPGDG
ncbi:hypothetical protein NQP46_31245 [Streptomyces albus]|nr:hypothetical protein NQP46_31245 [Streptomyces albus]